jgi:hypothetical protein
MKPPKKPPPDNVGNVLGRIRALKVSVRQNARMDARDGGDYDKALAKHMASAEKRFKKLHIRLKKVRKDQPATVPAKPVRKAQSPSKKATKKRTTRKGRDEGDILAALGAL